MEILVDTCGLLYWLLEPGRLSARAERVLGDRHNRLVWSAASTWEVVIKCGKGLLRLSGDPEEVLRREIARMEMRVLPIEHAHAFRALRLPSPGGSEPGTRHADPFDRMLIAQAMVEGLPILTADEKFTGYPVQTVW